MRKRFLAACGALGLVAAAIGTLALAHGGDRAAIHACVDDKQGGVRLVAPEQSCSSGEHAVDWAIQGPAGATGAAGAAGPQGPQGTQGPPGPATAPSEPAMATVGTISATGTRAGTLIEPGTRILSFSSELVSPRDPASGQATGKRQHKPFVIVKELDKSSPLLFSALASNENLPTVVISLSRRGAAPGAEPYMIVRLTNASIASRQAADQGKHDTHELETISFVFQKIEWTWVDGGITAEDDWETPVS